MPEYWATKFLKHNYLPVDYIRPIIWNDIGIQYWYRQNTLLFIKKSKLEEYPQLRFSAEATRPEFLLRIHPEKYFAYVDESNQLQTLYGFMKYKMWRLKKWIKHRK